MNLFERLQPLLPDLEKLFEEHGLEGEFHISSNILAAYVVCDLTALSSLLRMRLMGVATDLCPHCSMPLSSVCHDGGRCLSCGGMLCATAPESTEIDTSEAAPRCPVCESRVTQCADGSCPFCGVGAGSPLWKVWS